MTCVWQHDYVDVVRDEFHLRAKLVPSDLSPPIDKTGIAPDKITRVMVIRVEVLTHAVEDEDSKFVACIQSASDDCAKHFVALGRFAEPRLRRAMALVPAAVNGGVTALLQSITGANVALSAGE